MRELSRMRLRRFRERFTIWVAWRLPRQLSYWAFVRVATYEYGGNPAERTVISALEGWED